MSEQKRPQDDDIDTLREQIAALREELALTKNPKLRRALSPRALLTMLFQIVSLLGLLILSVLSTAVPV